MLYWNYNTTQLLKDNVVQILDNKVNPMYVKSQLQFDHIPISPSVVVPTGGKVVAIPAMFHVLLY